MKSDGGVTIVAIANVKLWRGLIPNQKCKTNPHCGRTKQQNGVKEDWASDSADTSKSNSLGLESEDEN